MAKDKQRAALAIQFGKRLKAARGALPGNVSTYDIADRLKAIGFPVRQSAVTQWENGKTMPNPRKFNALEKVYKIDLPSSLGRTRNNNDAIQLEGYVGQGGQIFPMGNHIRGADPQTVDVPPIDDLEGVVAVVVRGNDTVPGYRDGNIIYYGPRQPDPEDMLGKEVVVCLEDQTMLVRILGRRSRPGCFDLVGYNGSILPDQAVKWVAQVRWVKKD